MSTDIFKRLKKGEHVSFADPSYNRIPTACAETKKLLLKLNASSEAEDVRKILSDITMNVIDESVTVFTPFHINYGRNTTFGKNIFINFNCTFLDLGGIEIEDNVMLAPGVQLLSEGHPVDPGSRQMLTAGKIHIKKNAWIGAGAIILAGVTIGENSIVAAGAVVSKDVEDNTMVGGTPAKLLRQLNNDKK